MRVAGLAGGGAPSQEDNMLARLRTRSSRTADTDDQGFTLIELLVVIIIIGILAAIAIPVFLSQKQKGYEASMKSDLRSVAQEFVSQIVDGQDYTQTTFAGAKAVAAAAITGTGQSVGASTTVNLSVGNTITWVGSTVNSFCLMATTSKAASNAPVWYYENSAGGLSQTPCTQ
jgi:prepilin-type N-terminal cleavage/methylation domain-containing protein